MRGTGAIRSLEVNRFFGREITDEERQGFVKKWCVDFVYCPDMCPVDSEVLQSLREAGWLSVMAEEDEGVIFRVAPR